MSIEELQKENQELKERIALLEKTIARGNTGNISAYNQIRTMIVEKVKKEVPIDSDGYEWGRKVVEKRIMADLKWDLRVRVIADFRTEHIDPAKEYVDKYIIPDELKTKCSR